MQSQKLAVKKFLIINTAYIKPNDKINERIAYTKYNKE